MSTSICDVRLHDHHDHHKCKYFRFLEKALFKALFTTIIFIFIYRDDHLLDSIIDIIIVVIIVFITRTIIVAEVTGGSITLQEESRGAVQGKSEFAVTSKVRNLPTPPPFPKRVKICG